MAHDLFYCNVCGDLPERLHPMENRDGAQLMVCHACAIEGIDPPVHELNLEDTDTRRRRGLEFAERELQLRRAARENDEAYLAKRRALLDEHSRLVFELQVVGLSGPERQILEASVKMIQARMDLLRHRYDALHGIPTGSTPDTFSCD